MNGRLHLTGVHQNPPASLPRIVCYQIVLFPNSQLHNGQLTHCKCIFVQAQEQTLGSKENVFNVSEKISFNENLLSQFCGFQR